MNIFVVQRVNKNTRDIECPADGYFTNFKAAESYLIDNARYCIGVFAIIETRLIETWPLNILPDDMPINQLTYYYIEDNGEYTKVI